MISICDKYLRETTRELKYCNLFRLSSILIASLLFVCNKQMTAELVGMLIVSHIAFIELYSENTHRIERLYILIGIEILTTYLIIVPTGGIQSSYFWMILNPIMMGLLHIRHRMKYKFLILSFIIAVLVGGMLQSSLVEYVIFNIQLIFIYVAVVTFIIFMSKYYDELKSAEIDLKEALDEKESLMQNLMNSVELLEMLGPVDQMDAMTSTMVQYLLTVVPQADCMVMNLNQKQLAAIEVEGLTPDQSILSAALKAVEKNMSFKEEVMSVALGDGRTCIFVCPDNRSLEYCICLVIKTQVWLEKRTMLTQQMKFVKKLQNVFSAKMKLHEIAKMLFIREEQERIAEEIHDSVNQEIFAASCLTFNILNDQSLALDDVVFERLTKLYEILHGVNKRIKEIIYKMNEKDDSLNYLETYVKAYLEELAYVYDINILSEMEDADVLLDNKMKQSLFRILTECVANAVRHGHAHVIHVNMKRKMDTLYLAISDDGIGFNISNHEQSRGLGLNNMRKLALHHGGSMEVHSQPDQGTQVQIVLDIDRVVN